MLLLHETERQMMLTERGKSTTELRMRSMCHRLSAFNKQSAKMIAARLLTVSNDLTPPVYYRHVLRGNSPPQDQDILMFGGKIPKQWMTYIQLNGSPISSKYPQSNPLLLDPRTQDQCSMWSKLKNTSQKKTNL